MAYKNSPGSDAEKQKLSESLEALSKQMQQMGLQLPQLDDAISALANNQTDLVLKDIQAATVDLEKMRDMAKSLQQMQQQMEKMGKDLAEQLKNGQPSAFPGLFSACRARRDCPSACPFAFARTPSAFAIPPPSENRCRSRPARPAPIS